MTSPSYRRIVLIGLSGTGKSTVGRLVADRLGWSLVDTDADVEAAHAKSVPRIFAEEGEAAFRTSERAALSAAVARDRVVVATGGGAVANEEVWTSGLLAGPATLTIWLDAPIETLHARLVAQRELAGEAVDRPMLGGRSSIAKMQMLKVKRVGFYGRATITLDAGDVDPVHLAGEIVSLVDASDPREPTVTLTLPTVTSSIYVRPLIVDHAAELIVLRWPRARRLWVISDVNVNRAHGDRVADLLAATGATVHRRSVVSGETSKSWGMAGQLVEWLVASGLQRSDVVVALGGGVVGDLAGFVAGVALRGVGLVQIPTSLLAMVDSSIGGKTGVNLPAGKNLAGIFNQPPLVLIDPDFLRTLPPRELTASWAEVVKHAVIQPSTPGGERSDLLSFLEWNGYALRKLREPATTYLIRRNVALKAAVVEADERETGLRAILNYGHTIGHGIEAAGYRDLHGEAVAVGMRAAGWIARRLGLIEGRHQDRHEWLLDRFGLPRYAVVDPADVLAKMASDKKKVHGAQQWVLAQEAGGVAVTTDVPATLVEEAVRTFTTAVAPRPN